VSQPSRSPRVLLLIFALSWLTSPASLSRADAQALDKNATAISFQVDHIDSRLKALELAVQEGSQPLWQKWLSVVAGVGAAFAAACSAGVAIYVCRWQQRARTEDRIQAATIRKEETDLREREQLLAQQVSAIQVTNWCIERFYEIQNDQSDELKFYDRLFGLHYAECWHYRYQLLDANLYLIWLKDLWRLCRGQQSARTHWEQQKLIHAQDRNFVHLIDCIIACETEADVADALAMVPPAIPRLSMLTAGWPGPRRRVVQSAQPESTPLPQEPAVMCDRSELGSVVTESVPPPVQPAH
jgi:hypothetical protein